MGNAQEAIEEYKARTSDARRLDAAPSKTDTYDNATMILEHKYLDNGNIWYLAQWKDGHQRWVQPPQNYWYRWMKILKQYWQNQRDLQDELPEDEP